MTRSKEFRASVVEWLMTNHPHDCPVCEEGGHCHLQDMTVMTGHDRVVIALPNVPIKTKI
jgi:NADH-quinone oxidoreductase subunit G